MELDSHGTLLSAIVAVLALVFYFYTSFYVAQARSKYKIEPPAVTGDARFERAYRVQMNTLEQLVFFLPLLCLATIYYRALGWLPAALGAVWVVGRFLYMRGYIIDPKRRAAGFGIAALAQLALLLLTIWGIAKSWS
jgi:glutathione S-transferase